MVTARAARGSHSCINLGSRVSHLLCKCVKGACAQHPRKSQCLSWQQVALQTLEDQQAVNRGPLSQAEGRANTKQRLLGVQAKEAWVQVPMVKLTVTSRQAHNYRIENV